MGRVGRILGMVVGALALLVGVIWVLQGLNVLPGSFMTGQIVWAVYGAPLALLGALLLWRTTRRHR